MPNLYEIEIPVTYQGGFFYRIEADTPREAIALLSQLRVDDTDAFNRLRSDTRIPLFDSLDPNTDTWEVEMVEENVDV